MVASTFCLMAVVAAFPLIELDDNPPQETPKPVLKAPPRPDRPNRRNQKDARDDKPGAAADDFVGVIVENGKERRFTNQAEYDKAVKRLAQRRPIGVGRARPNGVGSFRGVINDNGRVIEFRDPAEYAKAQKRLMQNAFGRMRRGHGVNIDPFDAEDATNETGLVVHLKSPEQATKLWDSIDRLVDGKTPGAVISADVKAALGKDELTLEFSDRVDLAALRSATLRSIAHLAADAASKTQVTDAAYVAIVDDVPTIAALCHAIGQALQRSTPGQGKSTGTARVVVTREKVVVRIEDEGIVPAAKKVVN